MRTDKDSSRACTDKDSSRVRTLHTKLLVRAYSDRGPSVWSDEAFLRASEPREPGAPRQIFQTNPIRGIPAATHAVVTWNGFDTWGLDITRMLMIIDGTTQVYVNCPCSSLFSIFDLEPDSTHTFAMHLENARGLSERSHTVNLTVASAQAPLAPSGLRQARFLDRIPNSTHVVVAWEPPSPTGLPLDAIKLFLETNVGHPELSEQREITLNCPCSSTFSLYDLSPLSTHTFAIQVIITLLTHTLIGPVTDSLTHGLTDSRTHGLTDSLTH